MHRCVAFKGGVADSCVVDEDVEGDRRRVARASVSQALYLGFVSAARWSVRVVVTENSSCGRLPRSLAGW